MLDSQTSTKTSNL